jgi:hypothetical protein
MRALTRGEINICIFPEKGAEWAFRLVGHTLNRITPNEPPLNHFPDLVKS